MVASNCPTVEHESPEIARASIDGAVAKAHLQAAPMLARSLLLMLKDHHPHREGKSRQHSWVPALTSAA